MNKSGVFFLDQHGCAKNQVDGELIVTRLLNLGWSQTFSPEEADLIIVNSCGFIESAKKESLDAVYFAKKSYPNAKILLAGCLAERYASVFKDALPEADAILGNGDLSKLDSVVSDIKKGDRPVEVFPQNGVCAGDRKVLLGYRGSAFVKITEGCSNHCSFCAIPLIRGELRSRSAQEIIQEIKSLVSSGVKEINLIGQDLAAYGTGKDDDVFGDGRIRLSDISSPSYWESAASTASLASESPLASTASLAASTTSFTTSSDSHSAIQSSGLARLLLKIAEIPGDFKVRLLYIHPDHFPLDILPVIKSSDRFLRYFDIPFQSGDDQTILRMNRRGSSALYIKLVQKIREVLPDAALRTTFLAGFPGESAEASENTLSFLKEIKSDWSGCFTYSREEDTPAWNFKGRVPSKEAKRRVSLLEAAQAELTKLSLNSKVSSVIDVLIEEVVEGEEGLAIARAWFQAPEVDGNVVVRYDNDDPAQKNAVIPGAVITVKVTASSQVDLDSVFVSAKAKDTASENPSSPLAYAPELS